ncbi:MAG: bacterioferritin [Gammaproteobacteria bacterium]|nr:bacterioferritin [Gammaproteobacteria bacterium]|tara:strand:+ start:1693 stop:2181 length:489 start_codon:yes stop_codon:yes gene_type:complete
MKGVPQVVNTLNKLLAGELMAVDQYLAHGEIYSDLGLVRLAEHTLHESDHEREHARAIIQRILFLEGEPDLASRHPMTVGKSVGEMLKNDLQIEYQVADHLKKAVEVCEANQDFVSRDMLVKQIEDTEMDHAYFLEKQIRLIELVGLENYLQSQLGPEPGVQ